MAVKRIDHIAVVVDDIDTALAFWRDALGMEMTHREEVKEQESRLIVVDETVTLGDVVGALNAVGVTPRDLVAILSALKAAGALQANLEVI